MLTPHDAVNIVSAGKAAGDQRVYLGLLWLDIYFGRPLTRADDDLHLMQFGNGGECGMLDDEAKLWLLERELRRHGRVPGEELPDNVERLRAD